MHTPSPNQTLIFFWKVNLKPQARSVDNHKMERYPVSRPHETMDIRMFFTTVTESKKMKRKALGKGLGLSALFPAEKEQQETALDLNIDNIIPNQYQPRQVFDQAALESLAESLKQHGLIQPILVRKSKNGKYELIAGERRWRAAKLAGLRQISVIVKSVEEQELMEWALLENLQREDLNPMEKAKAYENLVSEFSLTQEEIAKRMSIDRSSVSNFLRLLQLPPELWDDISKGRLSMGHAKVILSLDSKESRLSLANEIKIRGISVRKTEAMAQGIKNRPRSIKAKTASNINPDLSLVEDRLRRALGTKVKLVQQGKAGEIRITYYSLNDLDRILEKLS